MIILLFPFMKIKVDKIFDMIPLSSSPYEYLNLFILVIIGDVLETFLKLRIFVIIGDVLEIGFISHFHVIRIFRLNIVTALEGSTKSRIGVEHKLKKYFFVLILQIYSGLLQSFFKSP